MATAKPHRLSLFSLLLRVAILLLLAGALVSVFFGTAIAGFGKTGTGYAAKATCSCRYVAGRDMNSCSDDLPADMWAVWLSDDEDARSVSASVPLVSTTSATYRDGYGCVLEEWEG